MILLIVIWRLAMSDAFSFFGIDFSSTQEKTPKPTESSSVALKFFGQDFGVTQPQERLLAPKETITEASSPLSLETIFTRLLKQESGGRHTDESGNLITSPAGARGITQLMPSTARKPGYGIAPVKDQSEEEYLRVGKEYLTKMYEKFGDWEKALAAYNAGVGNVTKAISKAERFGRRADGTEKGEGWLGVLKRPDGDISTEISIGVNLDGKEVEIPTLVPGLSQSEIDHLLSGKEPTKTIVDKAVDHARKRMSIGKSPFKESSLDWKQYLPRPEETIPYITNILGGNDNA